LIIGVRGQDVGFPGTIPSGELHMGLVVIMQTSEGKLEIRGKKSREKGE